MPAEKRELVKYAQDTCKASLRQALKWFNIHPSVYYYKPHPEQDQEVRDKFSELASLHNRWGFWMMHYHLRNLKYRWNHKKVYRSYTEMGLLM